MSRPKTIKRLVACYGTIQLITAVSVLSYREKEQQGQNFQYENYLLITPLFAPKEQTKEFVAFIEKMARAICSWERIAYISDEQMRSIHKSSNYSNISQVASLVDEFIEIGTADELYLTRNWHSTDQLLMNVYEAAEKICYGEGIGIYSSKPTFSPAHSPNIFSDYLNPKKNYVFLKRGIKKILPQKELPRKKEFDLGYFSLASAFGEMPTMKTITLDSKVYLETFEKTRKKLGDLINIDYINKLRQNLQDIPSSILLTSNFSEAAGRMSLENEIAAYREFIKTQEIPTKSILLIKPHPRDSNTKIIKLKSALSDLYSDIFLLNEKFLFYLPFEIFFMEVFLNPDFKPLPRPKIFAVSSACLTLKFLFNAQCIIGFGSDIVEKFFYQAHIAGRLKHEADLRSTI